MKTVFPEQKAGQNGSALFLTVIMAGIALATVAGVLSYSVSNAKLNYRANQYQRAVAAAEGDTEKIVGRISRDYLSGGEALVTANLASYRQTTLNASDSAYWADWEFADATGHAGQTFVQAGASSNYIVLNSAYAGLRGYASEYTVVSNARQTPAPQDVIGGVLQQVLLARIPIFQFAMYSTGDMEISCGQPFVVTGRVHSNAYLYIEPDNVLTFQSKVTAVRNILFQRDPLDSRGPPSGSVVYQVPKETPVAAMTLPIGTTNTPEAVREIIEPPAPFEDPNSPMGLQRLYNRCDMLLTVTDSGISASSGRFNSFGSVVPTNELPAFVSTSNSFWDAREGKTVMPIDLDIGAFASWCTNNSTGSTALRSALGEPVSSIYIWDRRSLPGTELGAVRLTNGLRLPPLGLTVVTPRPLYVLGHYNQLSPANLGTTNTSTTLPASLMADAITILSPNWSDARSTLSVGSRVASPTTVNAAILAGAVETAGGNYGGGMENFPRFLETWGLANAFTYNGSMVKMFPSLYATNRWGLSNVYSPPKRNWAYDLNFENPALLPPKAPSLQKVIRSQWATVAPNQTTASAH